MWITNVHKIYHCKVYGYTYIGYIEIGTGAIHLSFFFPGNIWWGMEKGKIHINFEGCVQLVSIVCLCASNDLRGGKENSWGTIRVFLAFFEDYICYQTQTFHNFLYSYYFVLKALISFTSNLLIRILSHQISFPAEKFVTDITRFHLTSIKPMCISLQKRFNKSWVSGK